MGTNMTDYISRAEVLKYIAENARKYRMHLELCRDNKAMQADISRIPAADVAPVVRCRECKYGYPLGLGEYIPYIYCVKPYAGNWPTHKPDWFCADGKTKEGSQ